MTRQTLTCGDCALFDGEECQGKYEGDERYDGSEACDEIHEETTND